MNAPAGREQPRRPDEEDTRCGPCRIGECGFCDGNFDLPTPAGGGIRVPLLRCSCQHRRDSS